MPVSTYPSAVDYTLALQNPGNAFADARLRAATFTQGLLGPYGIAGSSAVVFHGVVENDDCALRCYTREDASTPERYAALGSYVTDNRLSEYVGNVTWFQEEVRVKGARWPVLKMPWIEGQQLNEYVAFLADGGNKIALRTLAARWLELINSLQRVRFAHGDLQHGNILVDQQGQLRLVDFDSVWIPPLQGQEAPTESGHTSYQSQAGTAKTRWGPYMDTFSGLVIYLALTALAKDPGLWPKFNNGDNLLFERDDFSPPFDTEVWKRLAELADPDINRLTGKLKDCCAPGWVASKSLQDTLSPKWWEPQNTPAPPTASAAGTAAGTTATATSTPPAGATGTGATTPLAATPWAAATTPLATTPGTGTTGTGATTPLAATTGTGATTPPTGTPASGGSTGSTAATTSIPWHQASGPQPSLPGSLPPPPKTPVQSAVAPQSGKLPSSTGSWHSAKPAATDGDGSWWATQQGKAPALPSAGAAAKKNQQPRRRNQEVVVAWVVFVLLMIVVGTVLAVALVHQHH